MTDLPEGPLARLRTALAGPRGYRKIDALLSRDDADEAVAALAASEIFELVQECGFEDSAGLIELATPSQIRGCVDLDAWDGDHMVVENMRPWLNAVMASGFEKLGQVWATLDAELRALFLQKQVMVYDLTMGEDPDQDASVAMDDPRSLYPTPDGFFVLRLPADDESSRALQELLDELYRADLIAARHTIMAARSEPPAELEEESYRWRKGRLADLGYVDAHEALDVFQPLEPDRIKIGENTIAPAPTILDEDGAPVLPLAVAEQMVAQSFFARAYGRLSPGSATRVEQGLVILVNRVLAAARVKPGDLPAVSRAAGFSTATLSLGLETVAKGDLAKAQAALESIALNRLFRAGYTIARKVRNLAEGLALRAITAGSPADAVITAVRQPWPMLARVLDEPPAAGARPFGSTADVRHATEALAKVAVRIALVEALGVDLVAMAERPEPRPALDDHARTAIARVAIGGELSARALTTPELEQLRQSFVDGRVPAEARVRIHGVITEWATRRGMAGMGPTTLVDGWLADLEATLGGIRGPIDPRFVDGIVVAAARS
ncbi:MAG: DUF6178 family protein [Deltaproteobacteria bacterium]|nr:DUF6178 family protein [Deltaproteobacteria bacterium]